MPSISRIRFTNVVYENGGKRYNDELFLFDGLNTAILLENGGGKTVFIQTAMQAIIPHIDMAERKIKDTLSLENAPAHIAIEWIINDRPRQYAMTAVTLFMENNQLASLKYTYAYGPEDAHSIENIPFTQSLGQGGMRPSTRGEMAEYYQRMSKQTLLAQVFTTITDYGKFIENEYKIIPSEWRKVAVINSGEGNVDEFFNKCKTTEQLLNNLLIPVVEEGIEGDHGRNFVETFERQREHFKKNRILQDKIRESKWIKEHLDDYVNIFETYEDERVAFYEEKREAKAVANYIKNDLSLKIKERQALEASLEELKHADKAFDQKEKSYHLGLLKEQVQKQGQQFEAGSVVLEGLKVTLDDLMARKQNIEITSLKQEAAEIGDKLITLKGQLSALDEEVTIADVKKLLDENSAMIKGQFTYELALIERELNQNLESSRETELNLSKRRDQRTEALAYEKELLAAKSHLMAQLDMLGVWQEELRDQLFGDEEDQVTLSLKKDELISNLHKLEKEKIMDESRILELKQYSETKAKALKSIQDKRLLNRENLLAQKHALSIFDQGLETLSDLLLAAGFEVAGKGIYGKEQSIKLELADQIQVIRHKKEKGHHDEMRMTHLLASHEGMNFYQPEEGMKEVLKALEERGLSVKHGMVLARELLDQAYSANRIFETFPYLPITLVVQEDQLKESLEALDGLKHHLLGMVMLLTEEEVREVFDGQISLLENNRGHLVFSNLWEALIDEKAYLAWKKELQTQRELLTKNRLVLEEELMISRERLKKAEDFFEKHNYEDYRQLLLSIETLEKEAKHLKQEAFALDLGIREDQDSYVKAAARISEITIRISAIKEAILIAEKLEQSESKWLATSLLVQDREEDLKILSLELDRYQEEISLLEDQVDKLMRQRIKLQGEADRVKALDLYKEVEAYEPVGSNQSLGALKEDRIQLTKRLNGLNLSRHELYERIGGFEARLIKCEQDIRLKVKSALFEIADISYSYEQELVDLTETIVDTRAKYQSLVEKIHKEERDLVESQTRVKVMEETIIRDFGSVIIFDEELKYLDNRLRIEKATLRDRKHKMQKEVHVLNDTIRLLDELYREIQVKNGAFGFMSIDIEPSFLEVDFFKTFDSAPEQALRTIMNRLESLERQQKKAFSAVLSYKDSFLQACKDEITDKKLLESVVTGILDKKDFHELSTYQDKMTEIISKIIQVAEDDKRESDMELQTFLSHLLAYVANITHELSVIQDKTIIEADAIKQQIFVFDIPEWEEDEAKLLLRIYIDETIEYYEQASTKENATEASLRLDLEERLSVKNLLQVVLNERTIKIKCRKVTNDMKVSKAPMAWESSNKWSGGEKWSKNMTLFLSILNYLAEKKQHLSSHQKRQRAVILDNPFGKASSDHVLKPVFMIAQQLGFQIIALTAHAGGKFISEYFPVVYSCRLRKTADAQKQVMTNEKILNHVYLREKSPMTLMRMQEVNQISLFDE